MTDDRKPANRREWAELIAGQFETDAVDAVEEGVARGQMLGNEQLRAFLLAADYYIAGLQAVSRKVRVRDLDERHVAFDGRRKELLERIAA